MQVCALTVLLLFVCSSAWAVYGVRISDLGNTPVPPNPIRVWGKVTSESPLRISDGRAEIAVTGRTATLNEFLVLDGWWNGQFFSVASLGEMIYIPAGSFQMGNNGSEPYTCTDYPRECPQHSVYLSGYWIGKYEVTRGEYAQFMAAGGYSNRAYWSTDGWSWRVAIGRTQPYYWAAYQDWSTPLDDGNGFTQTDNRPVVGVSYYEAEAFCNWAGGHLPTEAQWEKAARWTGSYPNVYPWGNTWYEERCNSWYDDLYVGYQTAPVGSYPAGASPYGLHDMAGNVWEWCKDWYLSNYYSQTPSGGWNNPQGPASGSSRVLRGGGWYGDSGLYCRCAYRNFGDPSYHYSASLGFRLAR